jgi:hypothetical protein
MEVKQASGVACRAISTAPHDLQAFNKHILKAHILVQEHHETTQTIPWQTLCEHISYLPVRL